MKQRGQNRLNKVLSLDDYFPEDAERIRILRRKSTEFEAICRDFEIILKELNHLDNSQRDNQRSHEQQLLESIDGLHGEIAALLRTARRELTPGDFRDEDNSVSHPKS